MTDNNKLTLFPTIYGKAGKTVSLDEVHNLIACGTYRALTARLRQAESEGKNDECARLKKSLPAVAPHALFDGDRRRECATAHTGLLMFDIDHATTPAPELVRRASALPYVVLACVSPRGEGVHVLARAEVTLENHTEVYLRAARQVETALGERVDPACKDLARLMFLSDDPEAYYNPKAAPIELVEEVKNVSATSAGSTATPLERYLDAAGIVMAAGSRHTTLASLAGSLSNAGFSLDEVVPECVRRYAQADFGEKEITSVITGIYNKGRATFGCNRKETGGGVSTASTVSTAIIHPSETIGEDCGKNIDIEDSKPYLPEFPPSVYENLPDTLLKLLPKHSEQPLQDVCLLSVFTLLGSVMPQVYGVLNKQRYYPNLYVSIIGESGSGKGVVSQLHRLVGDFHQKVKSESYAEVKRYREERMCYEAALEAHRKQYAKSGGPGAASFSMPEPVEVFQKDLFVSGYTSAAKLDDMLAVNDPYCTLFVETELETLIKLSNSDFGMYNDTINKTFHHERLSAYTIARGSKTVDLPKLSFLVTGTPGMLRRFITDAENGTYPRLLIYRLRPADHFIPLSEEAEEVDNYECFARDSKKVLDIAEFLLKIPTRVDFTPQQRRWMNKFFKEEFDMNYDFCHTERNSTMQRMMISLYRIAMILTGLRKYEGGWYAQSLYVDDRDFRTALEIIKVCLKHSYFVSTSLPQAEKPVSYSAPDELFQLLVESENTFSRKELVEKGVQMKITARRIDRMLKNCVKRKLLIVLSRGLYQKTKLGKQKIRG